MAAVTPVVLGADEDGNRLCQFSKTKLCKFHVLGKCTKGVQCPFAHESADLRKLPDLRRTKLCKVLIQSGHCTNQSCMYAHSKEELRSTGAFHKTKLCRFMQTGHCTLGAKCNFAHSSVELREPETIEVLEAPPGLGGWEGMIDGLLSDDDEEKENSKEAPRKAATPSKSQEKNMLDTAPAYVHLPSGFGAPPILPEKKEKKAPVQDSIINSTWDFQSQFSGQSPIGPIGMPLAPTAPWDAQSLAYGGAFHDWAGPWAGNSMIDPYAASPLLNAGFGGGFGGGWDYSLFGPTAVDQMGDMKVKKQKAPKQASSKIVRGVRPVESGAPHDLALTPEK